MLIVLLNQKLKKMKGKIVKTIGGLEVEEKLCRFIDGEYYLIGDNKIENSGDIYLINNRYIRFSTDRIVFDHFEQEYKLKNSSLTQGIIGVNGEEVIYGYFTRNDLYNVRVILKDMNEKIAIASNVLGYLFRERKSDGTFYHISLLEANKFSQLRAISREIKESFPYDSKGSIARVTKSFETYYKPVVCMNALRIGPALKDYTFGLEFETTAGIIPNNKLNFLPLIPLRDGSISGIEYATIPLQGTIGLQALIDSVDELKRRTSYSDECSLHLHIGGMPRTVEFILAFYKTISLLQNDIFAMFPLYKKYNFGVKRKNYSAPFPFEEINFKMDPVIQWNDKKALAKNFEPLFTYLSGGIRFEEFNSNLDQIGGHPQDPQGNQKWNIKHRYSFVNLIPLIFGNHQTIEFRIHTPTYDINKIVNFLLINVFIIDYVKLNYKKILNGTDNLSVRRPSLITLLESYVNQIPENCRKMIFNELIHYISDRKAITEDITRQKGVVYQENEVHTQRQMKLSTYKYYNRSVLDEPSAAPWDPWTGDADEKQEVRFRWSQNENPFGSDIRVSSGAMGIDNPKKKLQVKPSRRGGSVERSNSPSGLYEQMKHAQSFDEAMRKAKSLDQHLIESLGLGAMPGTITTSGTGEISYSVGVDNIVTGSMSSSSAGMWISDPIIAPESKSEYDPVAEFFNEVPGESKPLNKEIDDEGNLLQPKGSL